MKKLQTLILRLRALVMKEILTLLQDPKSRILITLPPILQLVIFSFAATLEVKNVSLAIYNQDYGKHGYEIVERLAGSPTFTKFTFLKREEDIKPVINEQKALAAIVIPPDFSRKIEANQAVNLQVILDGRRSNAAQIVGGYLEKIIGKYNQELMLANNVHAQNVTTVVRDWFNVNLIYIMFTVPSLICILTMLITLIITSLSIARERELGTFDQLLVSPLSYYEILIGKTIPAVLIGFLEGVAMWLAAVFIFQITFQGSIFLMIIAILSLVLSIIGVGLFISAICKTQQQAILGAFIFMVPAVTLSGYSAPIENMPPWLQTLTWIFNPLAHALVMSKGLFLKNMPFEDVWPHIWPLLLMAIVILGFLGWFFNKRME